MIKTIPSYTEYCCDICSKKEIKNHRPYNWAKLILERDGYDYQGSAVADATYSAKKL